MDEEGQPGSWTSLPRQPRVRAGTRRFLVRLPNIVAVTAGCRCSNWERDFCLCRSVCDRSWGDLARLRGDGLKRVRIYERAARIEGVDCAGVATTPPQLSQTATRMLLAEPFLSLNCRSRRTNVVLTKLPQREQMARLLSPSWKVVMLMVVCGLPRGIIARV